MDSRISDTGDGIVRVQALGGFQQGALPSLREYGTPVVPTLAALEMNRGGSKLGGMTLMIIYYIVLLLLQAPVY